MFRGVLRYLRRFFTEARTQRNVEGSFYPTIAKWDLTDRARIKRLDAVFSGFYSDVFHGSMRLDENPKVEIAIKELRLHGSALPPLDHDRFFKRLYMEVWIWGGLDHPNIAQFHGFTIFASPNEHPTIISPWYKNGDIVRFMKGITSLDRLSLLHDVASGIAYLHSRSIVHGDIKGENVLIDDLERARVADFGLSHFNDDVAEDITSSIHLGCTIRFSSPELLRDEKSTAMSDMWAMGCLAMQILTGLIPFSWLNDKRAIKRAVENGHNPFNICAFSPRNDMERTLINNISTCWRRDPTRRPSAAQFLDWIDCLNSQGQDLSEGLIHTSYRRGDPSF